MKKIETTESAPVSKEKVEMALNSIKSEGLTCVVHDKENKKLPYNIQGLYISSFEYIVVLLKYRKYIHKHIHKDEDTEIKSINKELKKVIKNINILLLKRNILSYIMDLLEEKKQEKNGSEKGKKSKKEKKQKKSKT